MSLRSWKEEYYRTPAHQIARAAVGPSFVNVYVLIQHSLLKWLGVADIESHQLEHGQTDIVDHNGNDAKFDYLYESHVREGVRLTDFEHFRIDTTTCALCQVYNGHSIWDPKVKSTCCVGCPVVLETGETCEGQYTKWCDEGDAKPMIRLLETLERKHRHIRIAEVK